MTIPEIIKTYQLSLEIVDGKPTGRIRVVNVAYAKRNGTDEIKKNRPEIYNILLQNWNDEQEKIKLRKKAISDIEGLSEIRSAIADLNSWNEEFERSFDDVGGLGVRPKPTYNFPELYKKYPVAAAFLHAEKWSMSPHYMQSNLGRAALEKIISGCPYEDAISEMESAWSQYCTEHMWD